MEKHQNNWRFEKKFSFNSFDYYSFKKELITQGYNEVFPMRRINNLYLDTHNYLALTENIEGHSSREKARIRWYGKIFDNSEKVLEYKIKKEDVGRKEFVRMGKLRFEGIDKVDEFYEQILTILKNNNRSLLNSKSFNALIPTLVNSYEREYYLNMNENIRLTIDSNIIYKSAQLLNEYMESKIVIELKADSSVLLNNMFYKLQVSKYSKYVKGVLSTTHLKVDY